jgi:hypothetical protein
MKSAYLPKTISLAVLALGLAANSAQAQLKVLFLGADNDVAAVQTDILGSDSRFDLVNSSSIAWQTGSLPTLATLNQFDAVLAWTNFGFGVDMSNLLADYVDAGGGVVLGTFWGQEVDLDKGGGRLETTGYNPLINPRNDAYQASSLGSFNASSPLFNGVSSLSATEYRGDYLPGLDSGATLVASWSDGNPLLAYNAAQNIVNLTLFPNNISFGHASGDYQQLFRNSLAFVAASNGFAPVPEPSTYALAGAAFLGFIVIRRRFKAKA